MSHVKWTKIYQFHTVRRDLKKYVDFQNSEGKNILLPVVGYNAKVKLDGTNAGIRLKKNGDVFAQSRTSNLGTGDDNYGFARWVEDNEDWARSITAPKNCVVFGEWCGKGIQKRTAVCKLPRMFCVFAVQVDEEIFYEPEQLREWIPDHPEVFVLPWCDLRLIVDYADELIQLDGVVKRLNEMVQEVEACDPWVKEQFGIEGLGEGLVFYPIAVHRSVFPTTQLMFKAKGEGHQNVRQPKPVLKDPEVVATIEAFAEKFVTPQRLEQAVVEGCKGERDMKMTGPFLKWIGSDIKSESKVELEAAGLKWKDVAKGVTNLAREWWMEECGR